MKYSIALLIMAGLTYLIRMLPLTFFRKQIQNVWVKSFLYYIPYAVLSAMTFPAIFASTGNTLSAVLGFFAALVLSYFNKGLLAAAAGAAGIVCIVNLIMQFL